MHRRRAGRADASAPTPARSRCCCPIPGRRSSSSTTTTSRPPLLAATKGEGSPGAYNLAGDGTITLSDIARATGRLAFPVPRILLAPAALGANLPYVPTLAQWVNAGRTPVVMDTAKARRELGWRPQFDTRETLAALVQ